MEASTTPSYHPELARRPIRRIVIAGGGTAGWMVAAGLAKCLGRQYTIRLVESEEIGTVGVGEATIPTLHFLHDVLDLDEQEFVRATQATFKLGIRFENWRNVGEHYFHSFGRTGEPHWSAGFVHFWLEGRRRGLAGDYGDHCLELRAALDQRFGTLPDNGINYAYHFDATLYGAFLRRFSEQLGVQRIEGKIARVETDPVSGAITALALEGGNRVEGDFFVDCTGMRALLIKDTLGAGYEDWSHWLPCDRAVAVQTASLGEPLPYTRSIAHPWGWQWRIPLQHRVGNGLVYSSRHLSDEEAPQALLDRVEGEVLRTPRVIKFQPGQREQVWKLNCVAIGLSSGFLEPLESTSIHLIQKGLTRLIQLFPTDGIRQVEVDEYNRQTREGIEDIRDFIILHYHVTNRRDSALWRHCAEMSIPAGLRHRIQLFRDTARFVHRPDELFAENSWVQVMLGQGIEPAAHHPITRQMSDAALADYLGGLRKRVGRTLLQLPRHQAYIDAHCKAVPPAPAMPAPPALQLTPSPRVQRIELNGGGQVFVIDDFLLNPDAVLRLAGERAAEFSHPPRHPYPGPQLALPADWSAQLDRHFQRHCRPLLHNGPMLGMMARLARVTLNGERLDPRQRICHRDDSELEPGQHMAALVHYLFDDPELGGTVFFRPRQGAEAAQRLMRDACELDADAFERRYGIAPGYMTQSNAHFEVVARVPARWNRAVFYDGALFHCGDIQWSPAARQRARSGLGRLTLNAFFKSQALPA